MIYPHNLYKAAHKVDWRKVGKFLAYPRPFDEDEFRQDLLSWIKSLKFYDKGMSEERRRLKMLALFNYLWESNCIVLKLATLINHTLAIDRFLMSTKTGLWLKISKLSSGFDGEIDKWIKHN